jgi:hypothetical protein
MDNNKKLHEFVTNAAVRNQITFGDVRRLQRDYLPAGISTCEEAELLIRLDGGVDRADRAWTDWLVTAILDFAASTERSAGLEGNIRERLKTLIASAGTSTRATRKIAREMRRDESRRDVGRSWPQAKVVNALAPTVIPPAQVVSPSAQVVSPYAPAVSPYAVQRAINALPLAA